MKTATILALVFFAMGAASQDVVQSPTHAQCTFSDGTSIAFSYLLQHQRYRLSTNEPLLTTQGTSVPAGDYTVYLEKDSHQHWTLKMMKPFGGKGLFILSPPMSVTCLLYTSGSSDNPQQFPFLYAYSPYHHVVKGTKYPAVLFLTGDSDTRVAPLHARKMTAEMQAAQGGDKPILLMYDTKLGHSEGRPVSKIIEEDTDVLQFLFAEVGVKNF